MTSKGRQNAKQSMVVEFKRHHPRASAPNISRAARFLVTGCGLTGQRKAQAVALIRASIK